MVSPISKIESELLSAELWELGTMGIEEMPDGIRAFFEDAIGPETIQDLLVNFTATVETNLPPVSVHEANDREPILVGSRFVIVPANRIVLPIDAAMAFGSGRHETTQLCLEVLEQYVRPGVTVIDVGCGSGILALAAEKLGAGRVIGADINEASIEVARRHFSGPLFVGSADCFPTKSADLVLCNITGAVDDRLAAELKRIVKPNGLVIVSGFTTQTAPQNYLAQHVLTEGEWECWVCSPGDVTPSNSSWESATHQADWWL